jgi:cytochrome c oxidase subunit 2
MVAIGIVLAILVTLVAVLIPWLPTSASEEMERIAFVYWFATIICIGIFALVGAVLLYSAVAFRAAPEDDSDGPPIHGHTGLEIAWTAVPAVLVIAIGVVTAVVLSQNANAGDDPLTVKVYAQQFAWRFEYPDQENLKSYELVLPVDRGIQFEMTASDVIHSFWIPEMGQKMDLLPGVETEIVVTPTETGTFTLVCTELCGLGHATMRAPVRVLSQDDFDAWVAERQAPAGDGPVGAAVFAEAGCGGCHAFEPAGTDATIGPPLTGLTDAEAVREAIVDPGATIADGYQDGVMPTTFGESLSDEELDALVAYLTGAEGTSA